MCNNQAGALLSEGWNLFFHYLKKKSKCQPRVIGSIHLFETIQNAAAAACYVICSPLLGGLERHVGDVAEGAWRHRGEVGPLPAGVDVCGGDQADRPLHEGG